MYIYIYTYTYILYNTQNNMPLSLCVFVNVGVETAG